MRPHLLVLLENEPYPFDTRVRQEAQTLLQAGWDVTVAGPTGFGFRARDELVDGVRVLRYPAPPPGRGLGGYIREYAVSLVWLHRLARRTASARRVDVVVVVAAPDLSIIPALPLRRRGAGVVVDHHDPSPELFERKFGRRGLLHRLLRGIERLALRRADVVVAVNETCADLARDRVGMPRERVFVVRQGPDPGRIRAVAPTPALRRGRDRLVVWAGMITQPERVLRLVDAADDLVNRRGRRDIAFAIVGPGDGREAIVEEVRRRRLDQAVALPGRVEDALLRSYLATADVCVSVDEHSAMNDIATHTKVLDYMAMGRPVVQSPLREMRRLCRDATVYAADAAELADRIVDLLDDPSAAAALGDAGRRRIDDGLWWPAQEPSFLAAVQVARERGERRRACRANARPAAA